MDFISIDFETATRERNSPCELGLAFVQGNKIVDSKSWMIKPIQFPYFDPFNISIHGITPDDVADKLEFDDLWNDEILPLIEGKILIAHNAAFDFSVLRKTLESYKIPFPSLQYSCSYIISKRVFQGLISYDLASLCRHSNISRPNHRAENDSIACAELSIKLFETAGIGSFEDFPTKLLTSLGRLYQGGYEPSRSNYYSGSNGNRARTLNHNDIKGDPEKNDQSSIFYGAKVVFTGTLSSMARAEAWKLVADIGGIISDSVTKDTDFLIVGQQDFRIVGDDGMSKKQEKAQALLEKGHAIEVISEADFLRCISIF